MELVQQLEALGKETEMRIDSQEFYAETLRSIRIYLREFGDGTPAQKLQRFVKHMCTPNPEARSTVSGTLLDAARIAGRYTYPVFMDDDRRRYFVEEIRHLLLSMMLDKNVKAKKAIANYHIYIHLIELSLVKDMSLFEKMNEFLNINFKLRDDDLLRHAIRGNFGEIVKIRPELSLAMEELAPILKEKPVQAAKLAVWKNQHAIPADLLSVLSGEWKVFNSDLEEFCYDLMYRDASAQKAGVFVETLTGNFETLISMSRGWLRLIALLVVERIVDLKEFEALFEGLYRETVNLDYQIALDFLSYSRTNEFYFNVLVSGMPLNGPNVELLLSFARKNGIDCHQLIVRYAEVLQDDQDYDRLCRFIINHSIVGFRYTKETVVFFIKTFQRYRAFVQEEFTNDLANRFIFMMANIQDASSAELSFLVSHPFATWVLYDVVSVVVDHPCTNESILVHALNLVVDNQCSLPQDRSKELKCLILHRLSVENG